ncbi:hypothetical protein [Pedobacter mendelii]|uniref:Uncharacterized protein n=1 Tax=Pedobacter mendelii TaxID=1908240 RepID=A0ABQ2BFF3_9SPHI|nr:hypothetical protein [Pedobacter mendelii]GGI23141.1 hypothetical protein GCM10008119_06180 [Pedobacter mendelii]
MQKEQEEAFGFNFFISFLILIISLIILIFLEGRNPETQRYELAHYVDKINQANRIEASTAN